MAKLMIGAKRQIVWIMLPFCIMAVDAFAKQSGSIILKTGESYDNVMFSVDNIYKIITIELDEWEKKVSFKDIAKITDQTGIDITSEILGDLYKPPQQETWLSENSNLVRLSRTKLWNGIVRLSGNYSFPIGDYYDGIVSSFGFEGDLRLALNHQLDLRFIVSRAGMKVDDDFYIYSLDPNISILSQKWSFHVMRYLAAIELYKYLDKSKKDLSLFYMYTGLGAAVHTTRGELTLRNNTTNQTASADETTSESKFAMTFGIGVVKTLSKNIGLDLSVAIGSNDYQSDLYDSGVVYAYIFDLKLGVVYFF